MSLFKRTLVNSCGKKVVYWQITIQHDGRKYYKTVGKVGEIKKSTVDMIYIDMKSKIKYGIYEEKKVKSKIPTLNEYSNTYIDYIKNIALKKSWKRDISSLNHLISFFGHLRLDKIKFNSLTTYQKSRLNSGVKPATVNRELSCLRHVLNIAIKQEVLNGKNPVSDVKFLKENNKMERILSYEEEEILLNNSPQHLQPIIITALNTGMRKSEILLLKWENIDISNKLIVIEASNSKNNRKRKIPLNSKMLELISNQKYFTGNSSNVFLNSRSKPYLSQNSIRTAFNNACKRSNITGLRFHDLRHTAVTRMLEKGANIVAVSNILGHSSLSITMRYVHPDSSLVDAVNSLVD